MRPDVVVYFYGYGLEGGAVEDGEGLGGDLVVQEEERGWEALGEVEGGLELAGVGAAVRWVAGRGETGCVDLSPYLEG